MFTVQMSYIYQLLAIPNCFFVVFFAWRCLCTRVDIVAPSNHCCHSNW
jgi:hypothetical protein